MRTLTTFVLAAAMSATLADPQQSQAAPPSGGGTSVNNTIDLYYDFEVEVAYDVTVYSVVATDTNGKTSEEKFDSYQDAYDWASWLFFHDFKNVKIEPRVEMSEWMPIGVWDTRAEAEYWEDAALAFGFYARIVPVRVLGGQLRAVP